MKNISCSKSKKLTIQEDHVQQVKAEITAGGDVAMDAGKNLTMVSSRIAAGDEAYLVAGGKLGLRATPPPALSITVEIWVPYSRMSLLRMPCAVMSCLG
nr:hemagglutinin repeat-containing protein [Pseudomonas canavaninivorans]